MTADCFISPQRSGGGKWPALAIVTLLAAVLTAGLKWGPLRYGGDFNAQWLASGLLWMIAFSLKRLKVHRLALALQLFTIFVLVSSLTSLCSAVLATSARPLADEYLASLDAKLFLGFSWPAMANAIAPHTSILVALSYVYASLTYQPLAIIAALGFEGREIEGWRFVTAWGIALLFTLLIFPWMPAVGGYAHYGISPDTVRGVHVAAAWKAPLLLQQFRDGTITVLDKRALDGIITMPSFHAVSAVLLGWAFWSIRTLRYPFAILNGMMFVSSVPIGGHYLVDVVVGTIIAICSILLSKRLCGMARPSRLSPSYPRQGRASPA